MKFALALLCILSLSSGNKVEDFFTGLVEGLELDQASATACESNLVDFAEGVSDLYKNSILLLSKQLQSAYQLFENYIQTDSSFISLYKNCQLNQYLKAFSQNFSSQSLKTIVKNYEKNAAAIESNLYSIHRCESNFLSCGRNLGQLIKTLSGPSAAKNLRQDAQNIEEFTLSFSEVFNNLFAKYLSSIASTPLCEGDVLKLFPDLTSISDTKDGAKDAWLISVEVTVLLTCWETDWSKTFSLKEVISSLSGLFDIKAWQLSYFMNTDDMDRLFGEIAKCESDIPACGFSLVELVKLVEPWVNYGASTR